MIRKNGNRLSDWIMRKTDEVLIRFNRTRADKMESVAGISRPRRGAFRGAGQKLAPSSSFRWNPPPSVGRSKGGEVPPASPPAFSP